MKSPSSTKSYLGDGVYVDWEFGQVVLWTSDGITASQRIYLEREVWDALVAWKSGLHGKAAND